VTGPRWLHEPAALSVTVSPSSTVTIGSSPSLASMPFTDRTVCSASGQVAGVSSPPSSSPPSSAPSSAPLLLATPAGAPGSNVHAPVVMARTSATQSETRERRGRRASMLRIYYGVGDQRS